MQVTIACPKTTGERVAVIRYTGYYTTWAHAAYSVGYEGTSKTLCGKALGDPSWLAHGPTAWERVTCGRCLKSMAKVQP